MKLQKPAPPKRIPPKHVPLKGEPKYFLEPTLASDSMFIGRTDDGKIIGILKNGEVQNTQDVELEKLYFLTKLGLVSTQLKPQRDLKSGATMGAYY